MCTMLLCGGRKQYVKKIYEAYVTFWTHLLTSGALTSSTKSYLGSSSRKDTLSSCRVKARLKFRQLCNAQQIQCVKVRSMGKQERRGSMSMICNLSKYKWTMCPTTKNCVTSIYSGYMEIASKKASPRSRGMIQNEILKTKKT